MLPLHTCYRALNLFGELWQFFLFNFFSFLKTKKCSWCILAGPCDSKASPQDPFPSSNRYIYMGSQIECFPYIHLWPPKCLADIHQNPGNTITRVTHNFKHIGNLEISALFHFSNLDILISSANIFKIF